MNESIQLPEFLVDVAHSTWQCWLHNLWRWISLWSEGNQEEKNKSLTEPCSCHHPSQNHTGSAIPVFCPMWEEKKTIPLLNEDIISFGLFLIVNKSLPTKPTSESSGILYPCLILMLLVVRLQTLSRHGNNSPLSYLSTTDWQMALKTLYLPIIYISSFVRCLYRILAHC